MVAGFARTKESESPGEKGPQAWVGFIGTVLSCKARRIQRRRVNGQAASGQTFNARVASESERNKIGTHTKLCHTPHGATVWGGLR